MIRSIDVGAVPASQGRRKFVVNHPLTILRGMVAAMVRHGNCGGFAGCPSSRGSGCQFMGRTVPSADPSTVWLAGLIEAAEVLAAFAKGLRGDAALAVAARRKERAFATGGRKVCPFGTCARPHPSHLPLAAHITDGVRNP
jgi:hypothetical protein